MKNYKGRKPAMWKTFHQLIWMDKAMGKMAYTQTFTIAWSRNHNYKQRTNVNFSRWTKRVYIYRIETRSSVPTIFIPVVRLFVPPIDKRQSRQSGRVKGKGPRLQTHTHNKTLHQYYKAPCVLRQTHKNDWTFNWPLFKCSCSNMSSKQIKYQLYEGVKTVRNRLSNRSIAS